MGEVTHFLGIKFTWTREVDDHLSVHLTQEAFAYHLIETMGLSHASTVDTPYRSGHPIDNIPTTHTPNHDIIHKMQSIVGSLLWLAGATRPDLATITSMLSQHTRKATVQHIKAAKYVIRYIEGTKTRGISFSSKSNASMSAFLKFPVNSNQLLPLCDANWGSQDQSIPDPSNTVELQPFINRSMSGFIILHNGPLHWVSKRQTITARSSAEAEIYATDECVKGLMRIKHIIEDMNCSHIYAPTTQPIRILNDNNACVCWSKSTTTKGLRHMSIRENAIRESVSDKTVTIAHIEGKINLADIFTKQHKDKQTFLQIRDQITSIPPNPCYHRTS